MFRLAQLVVPMVLRATKVTELVYQPFLKFRPKLVARPWGGGRLAALDRRSILSSEEGLSEGIGESWECAAFGAHDSVICAGWGCGYRFSHLLSAHYRDIVGERTTNTDEDHNKSGFRGEFPLLLKLIDAARTLSLQVHPATADIAKLRQSYFVEDTVVRAKSEAWIILDAAKDANLWLGFKPDVTAKQASMLLTAGSSVECLVDALRQVPVKGGDLVYVPGGTVHAIGGGILLAEVQQASDTTFRIFDWDQHKKESDRRELHLEQAAAVVRSSQRPEIVRRVLDTPYFRIEHHDRFSPESIYTCQSAVLLMSLSSARGDLRIGKQYHTTFDSYELVLLPQRAIKERVDIKLTQLADTLDYLVIYPKNRCL